jgi:hypothetical protein
VQLRDCEPLFEHSPFHEQALQPPRVVVPHEVLSGLVWYWHAPLAGSQSPIAS